MAKKTSKKTPVMETFELTFLPEGEVASLLLRRQLITPRKSHTCAICGETIEVGQEHEAYVFEMICEGWEPDHRLNRFLRMCSEACIEEGETAMGVFLHDCPKEIADKFPSSVISEELRKAKFWHWQSN